VVSLGPAHAFVNLTTDSILGSVAIFGYSGVNGGRPHTRDINQL
jgi:hypothetical protein